MKAITVLSVLFLNACLCAGEFREFTDSRGNKIEARLLKDHGDGTIEIVRRDGWRGNVPLDLLSEADRQYVAAFALTASLDSADPVLSTNFVIGRIRKEEVPGFISTTGGWEHRIECLKTELSYKGEAAVNKPKMKAYIYDESGAEIERFERPPRRQEVRNGSYIEMPETVRPGDTHEVFFPITKSMKERRWKTALIVFGNDAEVAAVAVPDRRLIELDFAEKKLVFPEWDPDAVGMVVGKAEDGASEAGDSLPLPEMKSVKRGPTPGSTRMDDAWVSKADSLSTEVRVRGTLPSKVTVSAYFFDASRRLVRTRERPAMTNLGGGLYTAVPKVARKNEWYPVYFPFDAELKATGWQWAVVVFVADGQAAAKYFGPRSVTLADFEFPGRELVLPSEAD